MIRCVASSRKGFDEASAKVLGKTMTERQLRYRLRKDDLLLRKRGDDYMIVDGERNCAIAGGDGNGHGLSLDEVVAYLISD